METRTTLTNSAVASVASASGTRCSQHAWAFTEDDIETFRNELNKRSLGIASHWRYEDGVAFQVFDARV